MQLLIEVEKEFVILSVATSQIDDEKKKKIVIIMHSVLNLKFFWVPIIAEMSKKFEVILYIHNDVPEILENIDLNCTIEFIPLERKIKIWKDLLCLWVVYRRLSRDKPDLLQTVTPKAGLLGMLAGVAARVPLRIHTAQGQVWVTAKGIKRKIFKRLDWLIGRLATETLSDSHSQIDFLRDEGVLSPQEGRVLGAGSISGVDLERFNSYIEVNTELAHDLCIKENEFVFLYLGRLHRDKGLEVLTDAFRKVMACTRRRVRLIIVGPDESNLAPFLREALGEIVTVHEYTEKPEDYLRLSDVIVLPSFREGFGNVLIEAAAMGLPAVASKIYGIECAVADDETGILFEVGNPDEMAKAMLTLVEDTAEYERLSQNGIERTTRCFDQHLVVNNLVNYYQQTLEL